MVRRTKDSEVVYVRTTWLLDLIAFFELVVEMRG